MVIIYYILSFDYNGLVKKMLNELFIKKKKKIRKNGKEVISYWFLCNNERFIRKKEKKN